MRRTKIVCTLGPATSSREMIKKLIQSGMNVARLNFSHGSYEDHKARIATIREIANDLNKPVAILQDLQGPKLRVDKVENGAIELEAGASIRITIHEVLGNKEVISTTYKQLHQDVKKGDHILLDDGLIQLEVEDVKGEDVVCKILEGGILSDHKGINLPNIPISQPSLTEKDRSDLLFGIEQEVDLIAMSFVRKPEDVLEVKKQIQEKGKDIMVIAKLEKPEAIEHLDEILEVTDGVMVARGDLGVEMPLEKVPTLQKQIIQKTVKLGKPVITATQMLESMREHARPTRAEVSDVANAIIDGTDAVMLSAETATGSYPILTVETMSRIIEEAEKIAPNLFPKRFLTTDSELSIADATSLSACDAADHLNTKAIVAFSKSGFTARMVSKYRPCTKIIAFTPSETTRRQMNLSWGVEPMKMEFLNSTDEIIQQTEKILLNEGIVKSGDVIVILLGAPVFTRGTTNLMKLHVIEG